MSHRSWGLVATVTLAALAGCDVDELPCVPRTNARCPEALQCETVMGSATPECVPPVVVRGTIRDSGGVGNVEGARVVAYDEAGVPVSGTAISTTGGIFQLRVRAPRAADRRPLARRVRLRAWAAGYGAYPDAWRPWPSFDVVAAQQVETAGVGPELVFEGPETSLAMLAFAGGPGISTLCGTAPIGEGQPAPTVVAEFTPVLGKPGGVAAHTDENGAFLLHGLPPGELRMRSYAGAGSAAETRIDLNTGEDACRDLIPGPGTTATVSGELEIAGGAGGTPSVALVVASTYDARTGIGQQPAGLVTTAPGSSSIRPFTIEGVPPGRYLVLASQENDGLVQLDAPPSVEVAAGAVSLPQRLRLVPAITVVRPGASGVESITGPPTLTWQDVALEARYRVSVRSYLGVEIFARDEPGRDSGTIMMLMDQPTAPGMLYRLRVEALDDAGRVLTRTEEGRGIFVSPASSP